MIIAIIGVGLDSNFGAESYESHQIFPLTDECYEVHKACCIKIIFTGKCDVQFETAKIRYCNFPLQFIAICFLQIITFCTSSGAIKN